MARAALEWSTVDLARNAGVGISTVSRFETAQKVPIAGNLTAMQSALEAAGVIFLADGETADGGPGVRLGKPKLRKGKR
jgi:transcriptional regulator with XRE-family HTH domain